jgi:exodeoxyribonuclease VII large subunit
MYFTIKDESSLLKCVMFKTNCDSLKFVPENGLKVIVKGYVSVFERDGQYQLYAESMQPDGVGALHIAFEQLKKKLHAEGLFDAAHKKKLPFLPESIGVVTSSTGAVIKDILNVLDRRFSDVNIKIFPVAVQGEYASKEIAKAIKKLNELGCVDVIILARGGGSLEELWAFNEEIVARSIFGSKIPIISAIGHETDFTIADFVADMRAPTPSAAAEIVVPEKNILLNTVSSLDTRLKNALRNKTVKSRSKLERLTGSIVFQQPYNRVYQERMRLDILNKSMLKALQKNKEASRAKLAMLAGKLDTLSPLTVLARGYSVVKLKRNDNLVKSVKDVMHGDEIEINVADGKIDCTVKK